MIPINIISVLLFLVSPFLAIPTALYGSLKKNKFSIGLLVVIVSFLSYLYIPNYSDDKTRYIEIFYYYSNLNFIPFLVLQYAHTNDFILQALVKLAAMLSIKIQWVYFTVTMSFLLVILSIFQKLVKNYSLGVSHTFISLILLFTSISIIDLFSGTRFMFASSIMLLAYFQGFFTEKKWSPILLILVSINIHFGLIPFGLLYIFLSFFKHKHLIIKLIFVGSFVFLLLPKDIIQQLFEYIHLGGALAEKSDSYVNTKEDFSENYIKTAGSAGLIIYLAQMSWIVLMYLYLLLKIKSNHTFYLVIIGTVGVMNIFFPTTTIFLRYALFVKLLFSFFLISEFEYSKRTTTIVLFIGCFVAIWITQFIVMRNNIDASYTSDTFFLLDILLQKPMNLNQPLR